MEDKVNQKSMNNNVSQTSVEDFVSYVPLILNDACTDMLVEYAVDDENKLHVTVSVSDSNISVFYNDVLVGELNGRYKKIPNKTHPLIISEDDKHIEVHFDENIVVKRDFIYSDELMDYAKRVNYSEDKLKVLSNNKIPERLVSKILKRNPDSSVEKPRVIYKETKDNKILRALIKMLKGGSVRLIGPASTGKNTFIETVCWLLGIKSIKFPGSPRTDKSDLVGDVELRTVVDSEGKTHVITAFQERALIIAMRKGYVLIMDEINANQPEELLILHGPLDESRYLSLSTGERVEAHPHFCCVGTMNEGYEGVNILNTALCDRMLPIIFNDIKDYGPILRKERPDVSDEIISFINSTAKKLKVLAENEKISITDPCTVRGFVDFIDFLEYDIPRKEAMKLTVIDRFQLASDRKVAYESLDIC